jgi:putative exporter of polyketide antibiotics
MEKFLVLLVCLISTTISNLAVSGDVSSHQQETKARTRGLLSASMFAFVLLAKYRDMERRVKLFV